MLRFECPRCQTVFTRDRGDDDAFVECPSCGALAMSAGDATGADSDALARTLSSTHDVAALQRGLDATSDGDAETGHGDSTQAPSMDEPAPAPAMASDDGAAPEPDPDDSVRTQRPDISAEEPGAGGGIFNNLLGGLGGDEPPAPRASTAPRTSPPAAAAASSLDLGLDDELGDFDFPAVKAPAPKPAPKKKAPPPPRREGEAPPSTPDVVAPPGSAENVNVNLGDDAMGALEAAFDTLAAAPVQPRPKAGLSDDERRFLENVMGSAPPPPPPRGAKPQKPPPRPPEKPGTPRAAPPPLKKRPPSSGFVLSPEAREGAFIALKVKRPPKVAPPPPPPPSRDDDPEITSPNELAPRRAARPAHSVDDMPALPQEASGGAIDDAIAKVPSARATRVARPRPSVWGGLHKGVLAAAIFVGVLVGAGAGAALAPAQQKRNDGRARAELALADGNRYYEAARYDDALGKFKNAINNDRTYAPAHRAKGAALAKQAMMAAQGQQGDQAQKLWDEAAAAYREYLALEPSAIDGADIKEALARRGVTPVATGAAGGTDG